MTLDFNKDCPYEDIQKAFDDVIVYSQSAPPILLPFYHCGYDSP